MYTDHIHKTERLVFEAIDVEKDIAWYQTLRSDPSVAQWQKPYVVAPFSKDKALSLIENKSALVEVIVKIPNQSDPSLPAEPIGFMKLISAGPGLEHHRRGTFVISLRPEYHGKGYGTQALRWLLEVGFKRANLNRIDGSYNSGNMPAKKCYERLGFRIEGVAQQYTWSDGEYVDIVFIAQLRSEWEAHQKKGIINGSNGNTTNEGPAYGMHGVWGLDSLETSRM